MEFPNEQENILVKIQRPIHQAAIALGLGAGIMLIGWILRLTGSVDVAPEFFWLTAASCILLFAMFDAMISVSSDNIDKYWKQAIPVFFGLMLLLSLLATLLSATPIREAGSYAWIYIILTFGFFAFLSIASFIKRILNLAIREETRVREEERRRREQN